MYYNEVFKIIYKPLFEFYSKFFELLSDQTSLSYLNEYETKIDNKILLI